VKAVLKNKTIIVALSLVTVCVLGFFISELSPQGSNRSLASKGFSFDRELSDLASKRVIRELQSGKDVELGASPSELEKFLFEDLKGEFSLEVEPQRAFRLSLINGKSSSVKVNNEYEFIKKALGFLFDESGSYKLVEKQRDPASSKETYDFTIVNKKDEVQAEVSIQLTSASFLTSLMARVP